MSFLRTLIFTAFVDIIVPDTISELYVVAAIGIVGVVYTGVA